jgi:hypothetical protein
MCVVKSHIKHKYKAVNNSIGYLTIDNMAIMNVYMVYIANTIEIDYQYQHV